MRHLLIVVLFSSILSADADGKDAEIQSMPAEESVCITLRDDTIANSVSEEGVIYPLEDFIRIEEEVE